MGVIVIVAINGHTFRPSSTTALTLGLLSQPKPPPKLTPRFLGIIKDHVLIYALCGPSETRGHWGWHTPPSVSFGHTRTIILTTPKHR